MNKTLAAMAFVLASLTTFAHAADAPAAAASAPAMAASGADGSCESMAEAKKLHGAAKTSYLKKCNAGAGGGMASASCDKQAMAKKLHGAAKTSFVKKCSADAAMAK